VLTLAAIAGCRGGEGELIPVTGTVKYADGSAIKFENGAVLFQPESPGDHANGAVEPDGSFTMMTKKPGDGVKPGKYKVVLQLWKSYRDQTLAVPEKYGDAATTPLEVTVDADHDEFDFEVEK
jgi:hypothetical protein